MITLLTNLAQHRELLYNLTLRDIKSRYAQSFLGVSWAIIQPISLVLTFSLLGKVVNIPTDNVPRPVFNYAGVLLWSFFSAGLNTAIPSIVTNSNLVRKIYFPREIFLMSAIIAALFDMFISALIFAGFLVYYQVHIGLSILIFPVLLVIEIVLMLAISLIGSGLNVYFRDIRSALPLLFQLWMFATPVFYPVSKVMNSHLPETVKKLYLLNPMASLIDNFRRVVLKGEQPDYAALGLSLLVALALLYVCYKIFKRLERKFADVI